MITIIDYGMGNLGSIQNMIKKIGFESEITSVVEKIQNASKIILPGVGAFDKAMFNLKNLNLIEVIRQKTHEKIPLLGICLGMQLLADGSEEGVLPGLNLIRGKVKKFVLPLGYKVPHMGWNTVNYNRESLLFSGFESFEEVRFYFVHSYHFVCETGKAVIGSTDYGLSFTSAVQTDNIYGVQFHPEKSHKFGMQLLRNFAEKA